MVTVGVAIGDAARQADVSTRTVRYYEQLGLLMPTHRSPAGTRRYGPDDIARLCRIRELQEVMGFNLAEIATVLETEDRLAELRQEWQSGNVDSDDRRADILQEAMQLNLALQEQVRSKTARLDAFLVDLQERAERIRVNQRDLDAAKTEAAQS